MRPSVIVIAAIVLLAGLSRPALAVAPRGAVGAYVWSGDANASNPISAQYSYNSAGAANTVRRTGTGAYEVRLGGVGTAGGMALVNAYGAGVGTCKAVRWNQAGSDEIVIVSCFNASNAASDSQFSLVFFM